MNHRRGKSAPLKPTAAHNVNRAVDLCFSDFASIYLACHPTKARQLLKYASIIRSAAFRHAGFGWRDYDVQFRLRQARVPNRSWASIDAELWLTLLGAPIQPATTFLSLQQKGQPPVCIIYQFRKLHPS